MAGWVGIEEQRRRGEEEKRRRGEEEKRQTEGSTSMAQVVATVATAVYNKLCHIALF